MPNGGTSWIEVASNSCDRGTPALGTDCFGAANLLPTSEYSLEPPSSIVASGRVIPGQIQLSNTGFDIGGGGFVWGATGGLFTSVECTRCCKDGASQPSGLVRLSKRGSRRWRRFAVLRRRRICRRAVSASRIWRPRCTRSIKLKTAAPAVISADRASMFLMSRTNARPVVLLPGSSLMRSGCRAQVSTARSVSRITKGTRRCTRARPRASSRLARFSVHGITGKPLNL